MRKNNKVKKITIEYKGQAGSQTLFWIVFGIAVIGLVLLLAGGVYAPQQRPQAQQQPYPTYYDPAYFDYDPVSGRIGVDPQPGLPPPPSVYQPPPSSTSSSYDCAIALSNELAGGPPAPPECYQGSVSPPSSVGGYQPSLPTQPPVLESLDWCDFNDDDGILRNVDERDVLLENP